MSQMAQNKDAPQNSQQIQPENEGLNRTQSSNSTLNTRSQRKIIQVLHATWCSHHRVSPSQPWCQLIKLSPFRVEAKITQIPCV